MATAIVDPELEQPAGLDFDAAIDEVAGHLNAQHARLVDLTIAMLADESLWAGDGIHSVELFLAWRTGLAPQRARQIVAIARRADELPESIGAFRRGELAIDQMAAVAQRAPWWTDNEICGLAKMLTVSQLRRTLATYPFPDIPRPDDDTDGNTDGDSDGNTDGNIDAPADNDNAPADPNQPSPVIADLDPDTVPADEGSPDGSMTTGHVWWGVGDDGRFRLHLDTDALAGMTIDAALREAATISSKAVSATSATPTPSSRWHNAHSTTSTHHNDVNDSGSTSTCAPTAPVPTTTPPPCPTPSAATSPARG